MPVEAPLYAIILPVRNGGDYVKECVNSILAQSLQDFTLHVLDNNSTDGTMEWLSSLKDDRIKIYPSGKNLLMEENWGRIVSIKKNGFMTIIGHDDKLDPGYLKIMDGLIRKYPAASLYQAHFRFIDAHGNITGKCKPMEEIQYAPGFISSIFTGSIDTMGTGYMMRAKDYDAIGGIQPYPNLLFADHELWIRLTSIHYKATAPEECFSFRIHQSVSRKADAVKYIHAFYRFMDFFKEMKLKDEKINNVIAEYIPGYIKYYCRSLAHRLLRTPGKQRNGITVAGFIDRCKNYVHELAPGKDLDPSGEFSIRFAKQIDSNIFTRRLYLLFRKVYKKPIYT